MGATITRRPFYIQGDKRGGGCRPGHFNTTSRQFCLISPTLYLRAADSYLIPAQGSSALSQQMHHRLVDWSAQGYTGYWPASEDVLRTLNPYKGSRQQGDVMPVACWAGCWEVQALEGSLAGGTVWPGKTTICWGEMCVFTHTAPFGNCSLRGLLKDWRGKKKTQRQTATRKPQGGHFVSTWCIMHMNINRNEKCAHITFKQTHNVTDSSQNLYPTK